MTLHKSLLATLLCATTLLACGDNNNADADDKPAPQPDRYPELVAADPLALEAVELGLGLHHGESIALAGEKAENLKLARELFPHAMLQIQSYDELTHQYGEYTYFRADSENPDSAITFINTPKKGEMGPRTGDLRDELDTALARAGAKKFDSQSVVIDVWRTNREWYVRWDGLLDQNINTQGIGPYGMGREEMVDDLLQELEKVAEDVRPRYMIIGTEMELLWSKDMMQEGIARGEWSGFLAFYQDAVQRIKSASPETKVGVGINWDRFATQVAPAFASLEMRELEEGEEVSRDEMLDRAFRDLLLPLITWGDVLTLQSYATPDAENAWYYQWLRRLPELYMVDPGVVWYSISSPIQGSASSQAQRNYMESFLEWNGGVNVEAIYWERLMNIDGSNGANQQLAGRCKSMVEDASKGFRLPRERCFDGLFDSVFQPKPILTGFQVGFE